MTSVGYGLSTYGSSPYGGSGGLFDLVAASSSSNTTVDVEFSKPLLTNPASTSPASYSIPGLYVTGAVFIDPSIIRLYTSTQIGTTYTVTVAPGVLSEDAEALSRNSGTFVGTLASVPVVVSNLVASTWCEGRKIKLTWEVPSDETIKGLAILRRKRAWPYSLTDDTSDAIYHGSVITSYEDSGATLSNPDQLLEENEFYYYVVVLIRIGDLIDYTEDSRTVGLSLKTFDAKGWWLKHTPQVYKKLDRLPSEEGGGDSALDEWYTVAGCWLNLMHGWNNAIDTMGDIDRTRYDMLESKLAAWGTLPEGATYDFDTSRRMLHYLPHQYKIKGSCPGIVEAVTMLTGWASFCVDLDGSVTCIDGASSLEMFDDTLDHTETLPRVLDDPWTSANTAFTGTLGSFSPTTWELGEWTGGKFRGCIGDVGCIYDSDTDRVFLSAPPVVATLMADTTGDGYVLSVDTTKGLYPNLSIQVREPWANGRGWIAEILSLTSNQITLKANQGVGVVAAGAVISISKTGVRGEYLGRFSSASALTGDARTYEDVQASWVENQWVGFYVKFSDNSEHPVVSNDETTVTVGGTPPNLTGDYAIGLEWEPSVDFATRVAKPRVTLFGASWSSIYEPTLNLEASGSIYDPHTYTWQGPGTTLQGAWGPSDVGVFITEPNVIYLSGKTEFKMSGNVLLLDSTQPQPAINELAGMYLNPNQNQSQLFKISSNTATEVTLEGDASTLSVVGQVYYVVSERNANRIKRLFARLPEFMEHGAKPRILFF